MIAIDLLQADYIKKTQLLKAGEKLVNFEFGSVSKLTWVIETHLVSPKLLNTHRIRQIYITKYLIQVCFCTILCHSVGN